MKLSTMFTKILFLLTLLSVNALAMEYIEDDVTENYCVTLTWINEKIDKQQPYIFAGVNNSAELHDQFLNYAKLWADFNPQSGGGKVDIAYDSEKISQEAIEATKQELGEYPITLRDIRELDFVKNHPDLFTEKVNIYFRSDLIRKILAILEIRRKRSKCFIFANCNMPPLRKSELFDQMALKDLKIYGLVMARLLTDNVFANYDCRGKSDKFENGFFMYTGSNKIMDWCIQKILIQGSIAMARLSFHESTLHTLKPSTFFFQYGKLFSLYQELSKPNSKHQALGAKLFNGKGFEFIRLFDEEKQIKMNLIADPRVFYFSYENQDASNLERFITVPTKEVRMPSSSNSFNPFSTGDMKKK